MELVMCMFCNNHGAEENENDGRTNVYCKILRDKGKESMLYDGDDWLRLAHEQPYCEFFAWDCNMTLLVRELVLLNNWFCRLLVDLQNIQSNIKE